jgi:hypothetical protein
MHELGNVQSAINPWSVFNPWTTQEGKPEFGSLNESSRFLVPDDSEGQIEDWRSYLRKLAEEINQVADGTEYHFIKTFSIPIGSDSRIDIFA